VIWYGNLPEETQFIRARLGSQFLQDTWYFVADRLNEPYVKLTLSVWACCWIVPFWVLLGQRPKKTPAILGSVGLVVAVGFWLERNVLVWPSILPADPGSWLGPIQLGVAAGFLGAFTVVFLVFTRIFPTLAVPRRS
jgi:molybdopterin-containing oxidoreductase family membrane subunit